MAYALASKEPKPEPDPWVAERAGTTRVQSFLDHVWHAPEVPRAHVRGIPDDSPSSGAVPVDAMRHDGRGPRTVELVKVVGATTRAARRHTVGEVVHVHEVMGIGHARDDSVVSRACQSSPDLEACRAVVI